MEAMLNDFLSEIEEISPLDHSKNSGPDKHNYSNQCPWEKCFDEKSGYYYYWNISNNEVTWSEPLEYKQFRQTESKHSKRASGPSLYLPPKSGPLFPSANCLVDVSHSVKIYKLGQSNDVFPNNSIEQKPFKKRDDVADHAIFEDRNKNNTSCKDTNVTEEITAPSKQKADVITDVTTNCTKNMELPNNSNNTDTVLTKKQKSGAFTLIAGYSGSESESEEDTEKKSLFLRTNSPEVTTECNHSTLFPAIKSIDPKTFELEKTEANESIRNSSEDDFDSKAFQRKRRIGISLLNESNKRYKDVDTELERKGLGFMKENISEKSESSSVGVGLYAGFTRAGVLFGSEDEKSSESFSDDKKSDSKDDKEIEDSYSLLKEKLTFLSEGKQSLSPEQVMFVQVELLMDAFKSNNLKKEYLDKWLNDTCSDMEKLEKETAPNGWLLQWDRSQKRYYYQNALTAQTQWDYPQTDEIDDVTRCDEAMDISTTPPLSTIEQDDNVLDDLLSNKIVPSPPPASKLLAVDDIANSTEKDTIDQSSEPRPPGEEDVLILNTNEKCEDHLTDELSTFYSDIAALQAPDIPSDKSSIENNSNCDSVESIQEDTTKKKKKPKVKIAHGLSMKKKGVSKLVEKWKHVQMNYD